MRISDWSSDVYSSDLQTPCRLQVVPHPANTKIWAGSIWILTRAPRCGRYTPGTRACRCTSLPGREGEVTVMCTRLAIGRASCRERGCQYGEIAVGGGSLKT